MSGHENQISDEEKKRIALEEAKKRRPMIIEFLKLTGMVNDADYVCEYLYGSQGCTAICMGARGLHLRIKVNLRGVPTLNEATNMEEKKDVNHDICTSIKWSAFGAVEMEKVQVLIKGENGEADKKDWLYDVRIFSGQRFYTVRFLTEEDARNLRTNIWAYANTH